MKMNEGAVLFPSPRLTARLGEKIPLFSLCSVLRNCRTDTRGYRRDAAIRPTGNSGRIELSKPAMGRNFVKELPGQESKAEIMLNASPLVATSLRKWKAGWD